MNKNIPKVAIVGRPNVGKSSLFNRLVGKRKSIVDPQSGVTRDRVYEYVEWDDYCFSLVDTGGLDFEKNCHVGTRIKEQVEFAVKEATTIIFLLDNIDGLNPYDKEIAEFLRNYSKSVILAVNKVDSIDQMGSIGEFYKLGFDKTFPVSALHGLGMDDILMAVVENIPKESGFVQDQLDKIAIVGKPNVGKSTLLNSVLNEERAMVDSVPGTTRDIVDTRVKINGVDYLMVDTAGIRHKKKIDDTVESYAFMRTQGVIKRADLVLMLIDASKGMTRQDDRILNMVITDGKPIILIINKWDLIKSVSKKEYIDNLSHKIRFIKYVPVVFISAKYKDNLKNIFKHIPKLLKESLIRIKTPLLNKMIQDALLANPPHLANKRRLKIYYAVQTGVRPPTFTFFVNNEKLMSTSYDRYLNNKLRKLFSFYGSPIVIKLKGGKGYK